MLKKIDSLKRTLLELFVGIIISGTVFEIAGVLFVKNKGDYSLGILFGVLIAMGMAAHMAYSLSDALDLQEKYAKAAVRKGVGMRYAAVLLIVGAIAYFKLANLIACFLGMISLKTAAYIQPFVHKFLNKIFKIEEEGGCENAIIDDDSDDVFGDWEHSGFYDSWFN